MQRFFFNSFVISFAALIGTLCQAAEPLVWKFKTGEQLNYELSQKLDSTADAGSGGSFSTSMTQTMDISWNIEEVTSEGNAKIHQKIERVRLKMTMPAGQVTEFDSASDEPPQGLAAMLAPLYKTMTEGEFKIIMTPQGKIIESKSPEGLSEAMKNIPGAASIGDLGGPEGMKRLLAQGSMVFPEGVLTLGQQWDANVEVKFPGGKTEVTTTYEYAGTKEVDGMTFEAIKTIPKITLVADPDGQVQMTVKSQSAEGEILFDREKGRMYSSRLEQKVESERKDGKILETSTMDQTVDMKLKEPGSEKSE